MLPAMTDATDRQSVPTESEPKTAAPSLAEVADPHAWAREVRTVTEQGLIDGATTAALAGGENDDRLSLWLLAATSLVPGLAFANAELVRQVASGPTGHLAVCAIVASALFGIIQRYYANQVRMFVDTTNFRRKESADAFESSARTMKNVIQAALQENDDANEQALFSSLWQASVASNPDFQNIEEVLTDDWLASLPRPFRWLERRALARQAREPNGRRRWILRKRARQGLALQWQLMLFLVFLTAAGISFLYVGPITRIP